MRDSDTTNGELADATKSAIALRIQELVNTHEPKTIVTFVPCL